MNTLNATASMREFMALTREDLPFFSTLEAARSIGRRWVAFWLRALLFPVVFIFAQVVPFIFRRHLKVILAALPFLTDRKDLEQIKVAFQIYFHSLKEYRGFSLFRPVCDQLLNELDEEIDSIDLVLSRGHELQAMIDGIEKPA